MANELFSKDIGVYVDVSATATPTWKLAVCTTSKSLSVSVGAVTINNDCTGNAETQYHLPTIGKCHLKGSKHKPRYKRSFG